MKGVKSEEMKGGDPKSCTFLIITLALLVFLLPLQADATVVGLSDFVSDDTSPVDADWLDATLTFSVAGDVLDVVVSNETGQNGDPAFAINQILFNAPDSLDNVRGLELIDVLGYDPAAYYYWKERTEYSENTFSVGGFGKFDIFVTGGGQDVIEAGESYTFRFTISGTETYTDTDFGTLMSYISPSEDGMIAAVKFTQGPDDISGYGATDVPEPATICLLGLGALGLLRARYRKE